MSDIEPQLIEMQGFPTLFAWHSIMPEISRHHFTWPDNLSSYSSGLNKQTYLELLKQILLADAQKENVVLLEIFPHKQKTRVDFYSTEDLIGIKTVCLTEVEQEGKNLFYREKESKLKLKEYTTVSSSMNSYNNHQRFSKKEKYFMKN
jgi:hypothetical protein